MKAGFLPMMLIVALIVLGPFIAAPVLRSHAGQVPDQEALVKEVWASSRFQRGRFIVFSPDSKRYVTAIDDGQPAFFDIATGKQIQTIKIPEQRACWDGLFSADGSTLGLAGLGWTALFNLRGGQELPQPGREGPSLAALSPDGKVLVGLYPLNSDPPSFTVRFWDTVAGKLLPGECKIPADGRAFSDNGQLLLAGSELALSDDGQYLLADFALLTNPLNQRKYQGEYPVYKYWAELWDTKPGAKVGDAYPVEKQSPFRQLKLARYGLNATGQFRVRKLPDGRALVLPRVKLESVAIEIESTTLVLTDNTTGKELLRLVGQAYGRRWERVVLSPDGRWLASVAYPGSKGLNPELYIWDVSKVTDRGRFQKLERSEQQWDKLWTDLGEPDLPKYYAAYCSFFVTPDKTCEFLGGKIGPIVAAQPKRPKPVVSGPNDLRALRAIELLEQIHSPKSRALLATIAQAEPSGWLKEEARASLKRVTE